ncbi:MAG: TPM domain-containing protein, partial [Bacteroidia bacterium]|nr:TPM domain-containing protein [Bacteroidia bacterium]
MKSIVSLYLIFMVFSAFSAGEFPDPMKPPRLVNDFVNFLSPVEQAKLEQKLISFSNQTSTQISIVTVKSLNGYDVDEYADRLAEKWGIGTKGKNNGIIILVKPKSAGEKGEISIQIGYGMEGVVTDAVSKRIIEREILPNFKSGEYFKGLDQAVNTLISLTKGEFTADQYVKTRHGENATRFFPFILLIFFFLLF